MSNPKPLLDHIILLLPYALLQNPPAWVTDNFTLSPGGKHADGKTENRLILFSDGTYLELIAFVDDLPANREGHWWGQKTNGVIDWALTTLSDDGKYDFDALQARLTRSGSDVTYQQPRNGGRTRPDGEILKWRVTFPSEDVRRGLVPFFCHDVTPRTLRVPAEGDSVKHPSGVSGVAGVRVEISGEKSVDRADKALGAIAESEKNQSGVFEVGLPIGQSKSTIRPVKLQGGHAKEGGIKLSLILKAEGKAPADIEETIGDGVVSVKFE